MHAFVSTVSSSPINVCLVIALDHIPKTSTVLYFRPISHSTVQNKNTLIQNRNTQWYKKSSVLDSSVVLKKNCLKKMVTNGWFSSSCTRKLISCCKVPLLAFFSKMGGFGNIGFLFTLMNKAVLVLFAWSLALGGAAVGTITGAIKGQTTETGLLRGATMGAVAGAIAAVQLMELMVHGEPFSKVALLFGLLNGKFFMEWMAAVVQNAHQWEISNLEEIFGGNYYSDIFEINIGISQGLSQDSIKKLPESKFGFANSVLINPCQEINCIICLEDFKEGDITRILPNCGHSFHLKCIDEWLAQKASCPMCRKDV